ncbi:hypothetical protein S40288_07722 [Stachybotrys chartarum IBT 40288]|nr:hypothetical protein S40288_07722 [Stachybotrys chartarum IBT 40288]
MKEGSFLFTLVTALGLVTAQLVHNLVALKDYSVFSGTILDQTVSGQPLASKVDAWLGIDYATQPVGERRFKRVEWARPFRGIKAASQRARSCPQRNSTAIPYAKQSESCLQFEVFRTPGVPLGKKLPILVWIHGESFNVGHQQNFDGAAFVANSQQPLVVMTFNYRLGPLGSLPSPLFEEENLLNLGLLDQNLFLQFVQKHASSFDSFNST